MTAPTLDSKVDANGEEFRTDVERAALGGEEWHRERHKLLDIVAGTDTMRRMLIGREFIGGGS